MWVKDIRQRPPRYRTKRNTLKRPGETIETLTRKALFESKVASLCLLLIFSLSIVGLGGLTQQAYAASPPPAAIQDIFPDSALADKIASILKKSVTDEVTAIDLAGVDVLDLSNTDVTDLTGVNYLTDLEELDFDNAKISTTLSAIAGYAPNIERLSVASSLITGDLNDLAPFTNLTGFTLNGNEHITGSLSDLATAMPNASIINVGNSSITGSLDDFASHPNATNFTLLSFENMQGISGDCSKLSAMIDLTSLSTAGSGMSGDIDGLKNLTLLGKLTLDGTGVFGDISVLSSMVNLRFITAEGTNIEGDVSAFVNMTNLEQFHLSGTKVSGSIASFANKPELSGLSIATEDDPGLITGDIALLTNVDALFQIDLAGQNVSGDITSLNNIGTSRQCEFILSGNPLSGDIASLKNKSFNLLDLSYTDITGSIDSFIEFQFADVCAKLFLSNTNLTGDIAGFKNFFGLEVLNIDDTNIGGNILSLTQKDNAISLNSLRAANTAVTGSVEDLQNLPNLNWLDLSNTAVDGDLAKLALGNENLQELNLSGTNVYGDAKGITQLSYLEKLNLSNLKINLADLAFDTENISVDIPVLYDEEALTPTAILSGQGAKVGNQMVWQVPKARTITGTLSYEFNQSLTLSHGSTVEYSGLVTQNYTAPDPGPKPGPTPPPINDPVNPKPLAKTGDSTAYPLLITLASALSVLAFSIYKTSSRKRKSRIDSAQ